MDVADLIKEIRELAEHFELSKWELYGIIVVGIVVWRLPMLLSHRREIAAIRSNFAHKSRLLDVKLERQKAKQEQRKLKGGNS